MKRPPSPLAIVVFVLILAVIIGSGAQDMTQWHTWRKWYPTRGLRGHWWQWIERRVVITYDYEKEDWIPDRWEYRVPAALDR